MRHLLLPTPSTTRHTGQRQIRCRQRVERARPRPRQCTPVQPRPHLCSQTKPRVPLRIPFKLPPKPRPELRPRPHRHKLLPTLSPARKASPSSSRRWEPGRGPCPPRPTHFRRLPPRPAIRPIPFTQTLPPPPSTLHSICTIPFPQTWLPQSPSPPILTLTRGQVAGSLNCFASLKALPLKTHPKAAPFPKPFQASTPKAVPRRFHTHSRSRRCFLPPRTRPQRTRFQPTRPQRTWPQPAPSRQTGRNRPPFLTRCSPYPFVSQNNRPLFQPPPSPPWAVALARSATPRSIPWGRRPPGPGRRPLQPPHLQPPPHMQPTAPSIPSPTSARPLPSVRRRFHPPRLLFQRRRPDPVSSPASCKPPRCAKAASAARPRHSRRYLPPLRSPRPLRRPVQA